MTKDDIKPDDYYSPSELMVGNIFPWMKSTMTLMAVLKSEKGSQLLKPIIRRGQRNVRYYIKGSDILHMLDLADQGKLEL